MSNLIMLNNKIFKQFKDSIYYVSTDGEVYSTYCNRIIKGLTRTIQGKTYLYVDIKNKETNKRQHVNIHRMVYIAWVGEPKKGDVIRHLNDNSLDNRLCNLSCGTQKENIKDCFNNNNRVGNYKYITIQNKSTKEYKTFCPCTDIYTYFNLAKRESLERILKNNWFLKQYSIISIVNIKNLTELNYYKNVTTMGDECNPVE